MKLSRFGDVAHPGPLVFLMTPADDGFHIFELIFLELKIKIVKCNGGADMVAADKVAHINFLHSIFSQIDVHINGKLVSVASRTLPDKVCY